MSASRKWQIAFSHLKSDTDYNYVQKFDGPQKKRWKKGLKKDLQKTQNKLIRFLNKSTIKDKVIMVSMLRKLNMASVNQLNAQIKLTETWKSLNLNTTKVMQLVI